jgi:pimeloyl-ACP methyl ester carboxylesterase
MSTIHHLPAARPGSAPEVMIALHCSASSGRQWDAYATLLPAGMRLVAPELMGYGAGETWASGRPASLEGEASRLAPLLAAAGAVHLVGHSYGGAVALELALRWPQLVKTLTLFEPVRFNLLLADPEHDAIGQAIIGVGRRIGWHALSGRTAQAAEVFVDYWSGACAWGTLSTARRPAVEERMHKVRAEFEALFADTVRADSYRTLAMPIHLITGTRSPLPARRVTELIARECVHAKIVRLEGMGHMGPVTDASRVAPHLAFQREAPFALAA